MKELIIFCLAFIAIVIAMCGSVRTIDKVRVDIIERQRLENLEYHAKIDAIYQECQLQYPHDLISRAKCYNRLME